MVPRPVKRVGLVVVSSDKGLCGSFNSNLLKHAQTFIRSQPTVGHLDVVVFGSKALRFLQRRQIPIRSSYTNFKAVFQEAQDAANQVTDWFISGQVDEVYVLHTEMISAAKQAPKLAKVLPLTRIPRTPGRSGIPSPIASSPRRPRRWTSSSPATWKRFSSWCCWRAGPRSWPPVCEPCPTPPTTPTSWRLP